MISLADYWMGRDKTHAAELTPEIRQNAIETVRRVNDLMKAAKLTCTVSSGWRPPAVNAGVAGAAKRSKHMLAQACDLQDSDGALDAWCLANLSELVRIGLWLEHPSATKTQGRFGHGWCHVQTVPPKSGNRVFYP